MLAHCLFDIHVQHLFKKTSSQLNQAAQIDRYHPLLLNLCFPCSQLKYSALDIYGRYQSIGLYIDRYRPILLNICFTVFSVKVACTDTDDRYRSIYRPISAILSAHVFSQLSGKVLCIDIYMANISLYIDRYRPILLNMCFTVFS